MRRIVTLIALLGVLLGGWMISLTPTPGMVKAQAQILPMILFKKTAAATGFTGPGDVVSGGTAFYSCSRAYSSATKGTKACNICANVGGLAVGCTDVSSDATTGIVPDPTINGALCTITACIVDAIYDQTGNGNNLTQATVANMPTISVASVGSSAITMACASAGPQYLAGTNTSISQPYTYLAFASTTQTSSTTVTISASSGSLLRFENTDKVQLFAGTGLSSTGSYSINTNYSLIGIANSTTSAVVVNGTATTGSAGSTATGTTLTICAQGGAAALNGNLFEAGLWPIAFNSTQYGAMATNQAAFY